MKAIYIETPSGQHIKAFTWRGNEFEGIARAKLDAHRFGVAFVNVYAKPVEAEPLHCLDGTISDELHASDYRDTIAATCAENKGI